MALALLAQTFWSHPAVVATIVGVPAVVVATLGYRRSVRGDAIAAQSGIAEDKREGVEQVIEGLNKLVTNLQADNAVLREIVKEANAKLSLVIQRCDELKQQVADLNAKIESHR